MAIDALVTKHNGGPRSEGAAGLPDGAGRFTSSLPYFSYVSLPVALLPGTSVGGVSHQRRLTFLQSCL
ncbi:hypothetical protein KIF59_02970 [Enterobacter cloacae subsp. cloacae]|nr:hypothetical protein [Enterobacter cloacae subsp. cloacae]